MRKIFTIALLLAFVGLYTDALAMGKGPRNTLVLRMVGTQVGEMREIDTDGVGGPDTTANCFDITLEDPKTNEFVGIASDCLYNDEVLNVDDPACDSAASLVGCSVRLVDTAFFRLYSGTFVSQGTVSIQPVIDNDSKRGGISHITGSYPKGDNIRYGLEAYARKKGQVRLSGAVDMSRLASHNEISFDCLFHIHMDK
ncbi:MAG: hypothetical protein OEU26_36315 [Candidatus Tectomicrobia bacterium]|nr:hypothetical protein [Candidatus Tectomicrobia bacterium]